MSDTENRFAGNIERFSGYAEVYDRYRPSPPDLLSDVITQWAGLKHLHLVIDLGSGTGLASRYWAERAEQVIGIDPTSDMRRQAEAWTSTGNVTYLEGFSHQTGLPDHCAQVVSASQALHWMEPQATFREAARILVHGGVFAAYDYDWPPVTGCWKAEAAYEACIRRVRTAEKTYSNPTPIRDWDKAQHLARMRASGSFRYMKEVVMQHVDRGNAERLVGLLLSQGSVMTLLKAGYSEAQLGIDRLREIAQRGLGTAARGWYWSSRVRLGIV